LKVIHEEVDPYLEMAQIIHALDERPVLFEKVRGYDMRVVAGLCSSPDYFALSLGVPRAELLCTMVRALRNPIAPPLTSTAPCQEVVEDEVDLRRLPILTHFPEDGGPYVTAGIAIINDPEFGRNVAFHRLMRIGPREFAARIVEGRGTHRAWSMVEGDLEMAVCIGNAPSLLLAAAMSPEPGVDELAIANALQPFSVTRCVTVGLEVPADSEIVLEGHLTHRLVPEGPFVDLTRTRDIVRQQPVFVVTAVTHRRWPIYQALLPGGMEHKLLMGLPREPTIYDAVNQVCECRNVCLTPGGGHWLHAVVQIAKRHPADGLRAIEAAFRGHSSLKHVVIVDEDVDPYDSEAVEWAIATRFQASRDLIILTDRPGSSLDPSARHIPGEKARTDKVGVDATVHWDGPEGPTNREAYRKVTYAPVDLKRFGLLED